MAYALRHSSADIADDEIDQNDTPKSEQWSRSNRS